MKIKLLFIVTFFALSCKKYKDPDPFTDPRINNKFCNIPSAVNYNWNFPGVEDNTTCIFPAQIYNGTYFYHDSTLNSTGLVINEDSFYLHFLQIDSTKLKIIGFCANDTIEATATRFYKFTIDSVVKNGQVLCGSSDTIAGKGSKFDLSDTTTIRLQYTIATDSGVITHAGTAIKQ